MAASFDSQGRRPLDAAQEELGNCSPASSRPSTEGLQTTKEKIPQYPQCLQAQLTSWWRAIKQAGRGRRDEGPLSSPIIVGSAMLSFLWGSLLFSDPSKSVGIVATILYTCFLAIWMLSFYNYAKIGLPGQMNPARRTLLLLVTVLVFVVVSGQLSENVIFSGIAGITTLSLVVAHALLTLLVGPVEPVPRIQTPLPF